jgi:hypothetical protein
MEGITDFGFIVNVDHYQATGGLARYNPHTAVGPASDPLPPFLQCRALLDTMAVPYERLLFPWIGGQDEKASFQATLDLREKPGYRTFVA